MEVGQREFLTGGDRADGVDSLLLEGAVPGMFRVRPAAMVDAGDVGEDAAYVGARAEGVAIGADDVAEGVLSGVIVVEGEVCPL